MNNFIVRGVLLSAAILAAACSSTSPTKFEDSISGSYQLQNVRGSALPVVLFGQCTLGASQPCSACAESASSGTLTLKSEPQQDFTLSLVGRGLCTDPLNRSATSASTYTISASGSWSKSGSSGITFTSNNMNFSSATISGSTLSSSFNWLNADPGGQPAAVTATFSK